MSKKLSKEEYVEQLTGESMPVQEEEKKEKKILAIIGTANSRHLAPYNDPNCEIWGVAHCLLLNDIPRMDKVFEIHLPYIYNKEISPFSQKPIIYHANKEYACPWRDQKDITVIAPGEDKNLNSCEVFERDRLKKEYMDMLPVSDVFYATNSIAWMLLMAYDKIVKEDAYDEVHMYGIHLETDSEWQYERPCNEWWLGIIAGWLAAKGKKSVIHIPEESDVLRGYHEYGFANIEVRRKKIQGKYEFYDKSVRDMQAQRAVIINEINKLNSEKNIPIEEKIKWLKQQVENLNAELEKYNSVENKEEYAKQINNNIEKRLKELDDNLRQLDGRLNAFNGAKDQVHYFLKELNA